MCSPSSSTKSEAVGGNTSNSLFDRNRRALHQDYQFTTADLSQVCDGRNWEQVRHAAPAAPAGRTNKNKKLSRVAAVTADRETSDSGCYDDKKKTHDAILKKCRSTPALVESDVDATDQMKSCALNSSDRSNGSAESTEELKSQIMSSYKPVSRARSLRAPTSNCNIRVSPTIPEETKQQDYPLPMKQEQDEDLKEILAAVAQAAPPTLGRDASDSTTCSVQTQARTKPQKQRSQASSKTGGRRRSSDSTSSSEVQKAPVGTSRRNSTGGSTSSSIRSGRSRSIRRRSSNEDGKLQKPRRRRLSVDSNTTSSSNMSGHRATVRKLSEPMHRCSVTNQGVSGIMRRAKYSSNNLAGMVNTTPPPPSRRGSTSEEMRKPKPWEDIDNDSPERRQSNSCPINPASSTSMSVRSGKTSLSFNYDALSSSERGSPSSAARKHLDPATMSKMPNSVGNLSRLKCRDMPQDNGDMDNDHWVASGVDFSKNMEVYLFKS